MRKLATTELNRPSLAGFKARPKLQVVVVLDNIRSLHNVGSIFRTADAFNLEAICLCGITATPPHREIHRTALGATESVEWSYSPDAAEAVDQLRRRGYQIVAIEQTDQSIPLSEFAPAEGKPLALIFGNEVKGVSEEVLFLTTQAIEIPQYGTKHSLNVAVTAGIVLWELCGKPANCIKK
ncbi:MAG: RNA methyltransferase [Bacteroidota bacterium]